MESIDNFYGKSFYQNANIKEEDRIKFLFGSFTDGADIVNLVSETVAVNQTLQRYDTFKHRDYLNVTYVHLSSILLHQADLLGKINRVRISWDDSLRRQFQDLVNRQKIEEKHKEYERLVDQDIKNVLEVEEDKAEKLISIVKDMSTRYFDLFTPEHFPDKTLIKSYYVSKGTIGIIRELQREMARLFTTNTPSYLSDPMDLFKDQYGRSSLINLSDTDHLEKEWQNKYTGSGDHAHEWEEDELEHLLKKIDFNLEKIAKGIVRIAGVAMCIAGAAGKVASIITINPALNDISIKGALFGATLAISPEAAQKVLGKWAPELAKSI